MGRVLARLFLLVVIIFAVVFPGGCNDQTKSGTLPYLGEKGADGTGTGTGVLPDGTGEPGETAAKPSGDAMASLNERITIVLYFNNKEGYLAAEKRAIPKTLGIARAAINELIKGPTAQSGLSASIPAGTRLKDIKIQNGLATVDFSEDLSKKHPGGSAGESLTVGSIVNTLTQFPSVQEVQILVEGRVVETIAGHLDVSKPLKRQAEIIQPNPGTF